MHIAERHLIPKLLSEHGLSAAQLEFPRSTLEAAAAGWTREAGVRRLSQALAAVCRHVVVHVVAASEQVTTPNHLVCTTINPVLGSLHWI